MPSSIDIQIKKVSTAGAEDARDMLAVEEPLEIRLIYGPIGQRLKKNISVTMRTPGNDAELAAGFLFTEGLISGREQIEDVDGSGITEKENIVTITLKEDVVFDAQKLERHFYTSSSCGVCGKASIEAIRTVAESAEYPFDGISLPREAFYKLPELLNRQQEVFKTTGGLHASALFDLDNTLLIIREDIGRHNALDKLIGYYVLKGAIPLNNHILLLSGRASFELIQKAAVAGIKIVAAVGAPSSLAVQLANEFNITLIGFLREKRFNVYSGMQRLNL